jgi:heme/copper-type cytochrome/quinol oxidase subunit 2
VNSLRSGAATAACTVMLVGAGGSSSLLACPMCFSNVEETALVDGTKLGILVMLGIILAVQAAFVGFFFYLRKRAKIAAEIELDAEWSQLQRR